MKPEALSNSLFTNVANSYVLKNMGMLNMRFFGEDNISSLLCSFENIFLLYNGILCKIYGTFILKMILTLGCRPAVSKKYFQVIHQ